MFRKISLEAISALLVVLFVYTALSKLLDPTTFISQMHNQPLPRPLTNILIWFIPSAELIVAALFLIRPLRRYALVLSFLLLLGFTGYVGMVYLHVFDRVPCSCGGVFRNMPWGTHLIFNVVFTLLALTGICLEKKTFCFQLKEHVKILSRHAWVINRLRGTPKT